MRAGIGERFLEPYGRHAGKVDPEFRGDKQGKLILVTAITPTSAGEGKTVTSIGLAQALGWHGKRAIVTSRQPSLGPVFGVKGGAAGGGLSQIEPFDWINMHFTGDFHAIASAHNLLAAMLDAHLYHETEPAIDPENVYWPRTVDMNDRALRRVRVGLGGKSNGVERDSAFVITAASEVMAVFALASSREDLRARLDRLVVALDHSGNPVTAGALGATGSMMALLNRAFPPNLAQTTDSTPAFVHAGPFGNIAHGTSSVISQKMAMSTADYVITEAGFGADLGAEKYFDIVMRTSGIAPSAAVLVASVRALRMHGATIAAGLANLDRHLDNVARFGVPVVVAVNRFPEDTEADLAFVRDHCAARGIPAAVADVFARGGEGGVELAGLAMDAAEKPSSAAPLYPLSMPLRDKVREVATKIYGAGDVVFLAAADEKISRFESLGFGELPVCMAKTQSSFTGDPKIMGAPTGWTLTVSDARLSAGAGFVVMVAGSMMLMPGLGKTPQAHRIGVDERGRITGLR